MSLQKEIINLRIYQNLGRNSGIFLQEQKSIPNKVHRQNILSYLHHANTHLKWVPAYFAWISVLFFHFVQLPSIEPMQIQQNKFLKKIFPEKINT